MTDLVQKLMELGKYEIGVDDMQRLRNNIVSIAGYDLIFKLGTLAMQGVTAVYGAQQLYQGNLKQVGSAAAIIGVIEAIKYGSNKLNLYIDSWWDTDKSPNHQG